MTEQCYASFWAIGWHARLRVTRCAQRHTDETLRWQGLMALTLNDDSDYME